MSKAVKTDYEFDPEEFSVILTKALGSRTKTQFASECGVSPAYLSRYLNGRCENPPLPSTIQRIAERTAPFVRLPELLLAAGYDPEKYLLPKADSSGNRSKEPLWFVTSLLFSSRLSWTPLTSFDAKYDIGIGLGETSPVKEWWFVCLDDFVVNGSGNQSALQKLFSYYGAMAVRDVPSLKISVLTCSEEFLKQVRTQLPRKLSVYVSAVLLNSSGNAILSEHPIASLCGTDPFNLSGIGKN